MLVLEIIYGLLFSLVYAVYNGIRNLFPERFSKKIEGENVLITGGGSGIGRLIARKMAQQGATIVTLDVNVKGNEETVR